jgi:hypothetical protein
VNTRKGSVSRTISGRSQPHDALNWLRNDERRPSRPRGRAEYGQKRVQEIGGGTPQDADDLAANVRGYLRSTQRMPTVGPSCFHHPAVRYAAE